MRSIFAPWEITQDKPCPYEPIKFIEDNFAPFDKAHLYVAYINSAAKAGLPINCTHKYYDYFNMPGILTAAEIIGDDVWVTFLPVKQGKYWVTVAEVGTK